MAGAMMGAFRSPLEARPRRAALLLRRCASLRTAFFAACLAVLPDAGAGEGTVDREAALLIEGARVSVAKRPRYDGSYIRLAYPGGDPGWERGVCADLVIRAFRHAGIDLQQEVHRDIRSRPGAYGLRRADPNIDHRRVRHLRTFFERHARSVKDWRPGDIVVWDLHGGTSANHIGIVSDGTGRDGAPLVIHHMNKVGPFTGRPGEDDSLFRWRVLAHFRWPDPRS